MKMLPPKLYEQAAAQAQKNGEVMSQDPAVIATVEKQLTVTMGLFNKSH